MDGLSGMKLFEKFRITDDILPPSYEENSVDIIVKGINHEVNVNTWSTTLDTLSVPRFKTKAEVKVGLRRVVWKTVKKMIVIL